MAKDFRKQNEEAGREYILSLARKLFASEYHDEKRLGLRLLQFYPHYLDLSAMPLLEEMLMQSPTWDLVDDISIHLVGTVLEKDRKAYRYLKKWSRSGNFWMRRASLISPILLFRKGRGDTRLFYTFAERMLEEKEFFIRKAMGWGLREIAKADPDEAFGFLMKIKGRASGLTLREGAKRLPEEMKAQVLGKNSNCSRRTCLGSLRMQYNARLSKRAAGYNRNRVRHDNTSWFDCLLTAANPIILDIV